MHALNARQNKSLAMCGLTSVSARKQDEWKQADQLCDRILGGSGSVDWGLLLQPYPFFTAFKNYIQVLGSCSPCCCRSHECHWTLFIGDVQITAQDCGCNSVLPWIWSTGGSQGKRCRVISGVGGVVPLPVPPADKPPAGSGAVSMSPSCCGSGGPGLLPVMSSGCMLALTERASLYAGQGATLAQNGAQHDHILLLLLRLEEEAGVLCA